MKFRLLTINAIWVDEESWIKVLGAFFDRIGEFIIW